MISRAQKKDTEADLELFGCLNSTPPQSFLMVAGAGSGKTTSLIKGLAEILSRYGDRLRLRRQKVACVTYTEIAAGEIWTDVGNNPLVHVSTIHSFLWSFVRTFQADIQAWVINRIDEKVMELKEIGANFGPRVQQRTRDKNQRDIARYEQQRTLIGRVRSFTYGTGSDYLKGSLGHDDIIRMVPQLIAEHSLLRSLVAQQFPFFFVDESQDTAENVVSALKAVDQELGDRFCLGFFGDPMQQIYPTGIGKIPEAGLKPITKSENFRCPTSVLAVANAIRRDGDSVIQTRGRMMGPEGAQMSVLGSANLFILPADERRDERITQVRTWAANANNDSGWNAAESLDVVKVLVIVHRMAAKRLGFGALYSALNDKAPDKFKNGFLDGSAWPVRPFNAFVLPLVDAVKRGQEFEVMQVLRAQSPLLRRENLKGVNVEEKLADLHRIRGSLQEMMEPDSDATNADILRLLHQSKVVTLDPRILSYLNLPPQAEDERADESDAPEDEDEDEDELTKEIGAMDAFLSCPASQFWGYYHYINGDSPFSTQQGIKGAEFDRVLVILDDDEGTHVQFSYDKYLGIKPLSEREETNRREGKETTIERTRRLFYVCCTRARKDLIVVLFTSDIAGAQRQIRSLDLFPAESVHLENEIANL
jgi:DNA helicase-2/ATP-dependent DNA helicase PcrA